MAITETRNYDDHSQSENPDAYSLARALRGLRRGTFRLGYISVLDVVGVGYYVVVWTRRHRTIELRYPVCKRHERLATLAGFISQRSLGNLAAGFLIFYSGLFVLGALRAMIYSGHSPASFEVLFWCSAIFIGGTAAAIWGSRFTPVKVMGAKGDTITVKIASANYASEFLALNGAAVSK